VDYEFDLKEFGGGGGRRRGLVVVVTIMRIKTNGERQ